MSALEQKFRKIFEGHPHEPEFRKIVVQDDEPADDETDNVVALPQYSKLKELAGALRIANPDLSEQEAMQWLLHSRAGRALFMLHKGMCQEESTMSPMDKLRSIAKSGGVIAIAKVMVEDQRSFSITEHEFTDLVMDYAKSQRREGESDARAFTRILMSDDLLKQAYQIVKAYPGVATLVPRNTTGDPQAMVGRALEQLQELAEEQRRRCPELTVAQAFTRVCKDNPELFARERAEARARLYAAASGVRVAAV